MSETGVVKFQCEHLTVPLPDLPWLSELNACRAKLLRAGLIGVDPNGIGFGNISVRDGKGGRQFYITGSGTGGLPQLGLEHLAKVVDYDFERNWLKGEGRIIASSESLTHAAIYESAAEVGAVVHCHSAKLWTKLRGIVPTTSKEIEYGTPAMAYEVRRLFATTDVRAQKIFVLSGHEEGLIAFGADLEEAAAAIERRCSESSTAV